MYRPPPRYAKVCDAVKAYETCLTLKNLAEDDKVEAMSHVATYDCKPPVVGPEITTDEGSLLFTVDNDRSMLFHRRAAHTIDVTQLSDRVDAVEQLAAGLTYVIANICVPARFCYRSAEEPRKAFFLLFLKAFFSPETSFTSHPSLYLSRNQSIIPLTCIATLRPYPSRPNVTHSTVCIPLLFSKNQKKPKKKPPSL